MTQQPLLFDTARNSDHLTRSLPTFDAKKSVAERDKGMQKAADHKRELLEQAREIAVAIAKRKGTVTADDVAYEMECREMGSLGNAAGSLFQKKFVWTGRYVKSVRVHAHSNLLREWKLK